MLVLDTTPAAKLRPDSAEHEVAVQRWVDRDPFAITAAVAFELRYGLERRRGQRGWDLQRAYLDDLVDGGILTVLPFDGRASAVAAWLRATHRTPPANASAKTDRRSKADSRVAWALDIQTAATVFVTGASLASDDAHHGVLADELRVYGGGPAHDVVPAPF